LPPMVAASDCPALVAAKARDTAAIRNAEVRRYDFMADPFLQEDNSLGEGGTAIGHRNKLLASHSNIRILE